MPGAGATILVPREHGTYGELLSPLVSALLLASPGRAAWGLACIAAGGFLAHEAVAVLAGRRGPRARRDGRAAAWRSLAAFGSVAAAGATLAWPALTPDTLAAAGAVTVLSIAAMTVTWFGREHTLGGELLAAAALSGWSLPIGLAGALAMPVAGAVWLVWTGVFWVATCAVRTVVVRTARRPTAPLTALGLLFAVAAATGIGWLAASGHIPSLTIVALVPVIILWLALTIVPVHAARLRVIGWTMAGVCLLTLALIVATL